MKEDQYIKIYERIYDEPKDKDGNEKPNKLLGEFKIIYGEMDGKMDYAFSLIGISKEDGFLYNIIGDEVSGYYHKGQGGTKCRIAKINLEREHWE